MSENRCFKCQKPDEIGKKLKVWTNTIRDKLILIEEARFYNFEEPKTYEFAERIIDDKIYYHSSCYRYYTSVKKCYIDKYLHKNDSKDDSPKGLEAHRYNILLKLTLTQKSKIFNFLCFSLGSKKII